MFFAIVRTALNFEHTFAFYPISATIFLFDETDLGCFGFAETPH
jgi:hypothetical protein